MAKAPEPKDPGTGTNALLAQILDTDKQILDTEKQVLVSNKQIADSNKEIADTAKKTLVALASIADGSAKVSAALLAIAAALKDSAKTDTALLKVEMDSKVILQEILDALTGTGETHVYTVKVQQLADQVAKQVAALIKK